MQYFSSVMNVNSGILNCIVINFTLYHFRGGIQEMEVVQGDADNAVAWQHICKISTEMEMEAQRRGGGTVTAQRESWVISASHSGD